MTVGRTITSFNDRLAQPLASGATLVYKAKLVDENDAPITASNLTTLVLSILDTKTGAVVNSVDETDILNVDRGSVDSVGNLIVILDPEDTTISGKSADRSLVFTWTFAGGTKTGRHQLDFKIISLSGDPP